MGCCDDKRLAAVVGTDMRGDNINGAPNGVPDERNCWAVKPGMDGDNRRLSAADAAKRRHSSSQARTDNSLWWTNIIKFC